LSKEEQQKHKEDERIYFGEGRKNFFCCLLLPTSNSSKRGMIEFNARAEKRRERKKIIFIFLPHSDSMVGRL